MNNSWALIKTELLTASEVIDALGGTAVVARLTGKTMGAVSNWRATGRLAPETFLILTAALAERALSAPPALWGIKAVPAASPTAD